MDSSVLSALNPAASLKGRSMAPCGVFGRIVVFESVFTDPS